MDVVEGSNDYPGTISCPLSSLEQAITIAGSESASNPEIILRAGLYHENVSIDNIDNLLIRAADGERVVFDGTRSITDDLGGVWDSADSDGIQEVTLSQDGWQLFLAHEEQVPARWPNAQFSDDTVFNRSYWAEGTLTNSNNAYTIGWLTDAGPEAGVHTGLNETVNATGLDPVGAIAVMNLGSFRTNSRIITDWNPNNGTFAYDGTGVGWKTKHHAYFLEGKRELIDQDGEWWFNNTNNRLHYKTPSSRDANNLDLRVKVQPFAVNVDNSDGVAIQGIDFFGTTVNFNNCDGCSLTNASLQYPSTSKRGLGIAGESEDDRWMTRFYGSTNSFVDNISITDTDGGAIEFHGSGGQSHNNTVNNSYFHAIDWSAADQKGLMTTIYEGGRDMYFTNNSVHLTGASSVLSIGDAPKVFYNEVWDVGHLQTDGAVVQVMQGEAPGAEIAYNWIHDVIKYGARFDAPINQVGAGANGTMHHNVIWNAAGGLMVKGDYHNIHNNTVFNSTGKNDIIFLTDGDINNKNSTLHYNAVDAMADHRSDDIFANPVPYGTDWMNWNGYIQGKQDALTTLNGEVSNVDIGSTCIINSTKSLLCWGSNANGRLGLGNTTDQYSPVAVTFTNGGTVEKVADSGGYPLHNCAIMTNGSLYCWGKNSDGELGIGSTTEQNTPQLVNLGSGVKAVDVSVGSSFTCAVTDAGALMCWGSNGYGRLGIGSTSPSYHSTPQNASLPTNRKAVDVQLGHVHACALLDNGDVACWGYNGAGGLGTGNTVQRTSPTVVSLDSQRQVASISPGKHHTCISYDNGSVVCAGRDNRGQQGDASDTSNDVTFTYTDQLANLSIIALAGEYVSCALLANGTAQCWGEGGEGQMGDGTTGDNAYPDDLVNTPSGRFIVDMSMSGQHACIVLDDESVACWGLNNNGQLGLGNTTNQLQPVVLTGLDDLSTTSVHEMLVDPANNDFRPKWGSHLHVLNAGAYAADDADPWTAGISWTYTTPSAPVAGCMLDYADNYDADATLSDGSCLFASYSPPSTLDLRLHLDPTNSSSYSGSGTNLADLSTYGNDGTIDGAEWEANRTRFYYDGSCSGATAPANQAGTYVCDEVTFAETNDHDPDTNGDWSISVWMNATTVQHSVILGKWNGGGSASDLGYIIRIGSDNKLYTSVGTTSGPSAVSTSRISIDEDRWYHLVMVADVGNMLRLYADGVNVVNASLLGSGSIRNTTSGISIGSYNAGEYNQPFDGNIGEVMIFADALNSTTINQMYNASKGTYSNTTSLSYSDSSYTFLKGQAYNLPLSVSNGDLKTSYTLIGSLPSGMNFGSSNGTIWGTPTAHMTSTTYTVTANNSAGSFSTTFSMQIMSAPSGVSYSPSSMTLERGTVMTTNTPTYSGSTVTSWSISPALPTGLNFDTSTGAISGTPSVLQTSAQSYTITATNSQGSATTSVSITINDQAPDISYTSPVEISNNREMTTISPVNTGGTVTSWVITPSLPTGLSFGSTNGSIWGVPENVTSDVTYTIWANNSGGANSTTLTLSVNWTLTPSVAGVSITRNSSIGTDITWEWDYNPLEASNLTMFATWRNTCAIRDDGDLYCWGRNGNGQLGIGSMGSSTWKTKPTRTNSLGSDAVSVSMGEQHTCAVLDTGVLKCWGRNNHGQVGAGPGGDEDTPQTINVGSGRTVTSVYLGYHHTCAILDDQSVKCWGRNQDGELGVGSTTSSFNTPQSIASLGTNRYAVSLALGQGFTCALLDDGSIKCWGQDNLGQRGDGGGYGSDIRSPPSSSITLPTGRTAKQISAGEFHVCALLDDDSVVCWGNNAEGQLGDGTTSHRTAPVNVSSFGSGHTVSYVSAGYDHVCALLTDGGVRCWGSNNNGQLGDGTSTDRSTPPSSDVNLGSGYTAIGISSGGGHTCAMLHDGDMKCWGARGSGQVGDNSALGSNDVLSPVFVQGSRVWEEGDFLTSPAVTGATCSVSPVLPTGLSLTSGTCAITGTPTVTASNTTYTVWANVSGNSFSGQVWIEVVLNTPNPSYSPSTFTFTKNTSISSINPANTGGEISSWSISPSLPSGLSFGTTNGSIWGTPTSISSTTSYTITATNSAGSSNSAISITVNEIAPSVVYNPNTLTLTRGVTMSALDINNTGGAITTCSPSPSLPSGLSISNSCQITGTPSSVISSTTFTITASNSGGSDSTTITIQVNDVPPNTIIYNPHNMSLVRNTAMSANTPSVSGGSVTTWAISPALPSGLTFSTNSGLISGTPSTLQTTAQQYTVWANNSGGSASTTINITILEQAPSGLNYNPSALVLTVNTTMSPSNPIVFGGAITTWQISPALPAGLSFGTSNGSIWGAPTSIQSLTTFTIWANNSGGSNSTTITITVNDQIPTVTYTPNTLVLDKDSQSSDLPLTATLNGSGTITSWAISSTLPAGLNFGSSNGTIWGIPTVLQTTAVTYMIWANNTGGSTSATVTITINDVAPGPFEYNPENNTWTNNTEVHLAPVFINRTTGNGSTWQVADINNGQSSSHSAPGQNIRILVGDTIYFDAFEVATGTELWAYNTSNQSLWRVTDIRSGSGGSYPGEYSSILVGDTLYFSANDGSTGQELWAHNTSNHSTWQVEDIRNGPNTGSPGSNMMHVINGVLYFDAHDGNAGKELWKHDPSTGTTSRVYDINAGGTGSATGKWLNIVVGDVLYFSATDGSTGSELWAYNTSNSSNPWRVMDINSGGTGSEPGKDMSVLVGDTIYFDAGATGGRELWAHNSSNQSTWRVVDIRTGSIGSNPGDWMALLVGDTIYFDADDGSAGTELWAHDTSNQSTWRVTDINWGSGNSGPGNYMSILVGDTVYFSAYNQLSGTELWAHDTLNHSTWQVAEINNYLTMGGGTGSNPGERMAVSVGDTVYFSANDGTGKELWAHDTSNRSTWKVVDINSGPNGGTPGYWMEILAGDTLLFSADDGNTGHELWAHRPSRIDYNTNTGGNVTTWAINASLPSGVSFGTNNGTIYGTPTELWTQTAYMVWANNSGGSSVAYLNITVVDELPTISYSPENVTLTNNTASSDLPLAPTITGSGAITSWTLNNTNLPTGISFGSSNGTLYGTATQLWTTTAYKVWGNNTGGSVVAYFNLTVNDQVPTLSYSPENLTLTKNQTSSDLPLAPTISGSGAITSWALNNTSLPSGISFSTSTGTFSGTPTELWPTQAYMVWANNTGGSVVAYLNITVNDQIPTLSYTPNTLVLTINNQSSDLPLNATLTGSGEITSWAINATLPAGLNFGTSNGTIWGIPTVLQTTATTYTVWANNSGGSTSATINITVNDEAPVISYSTTEITGTKDVAISPHVGPTTSGGTITSWEISPDPGSAFHFNTGNGYISGTPSILLSRTQYTIWANNSGGSSVAYVNVTINDQLPTLSYSPENLTLTKGQASSDLPLNATLSGSGTITSWAINATLPAGLNFGTTNGTIWGIPTVLQTTATTYTVWANNSGGSTVAYLNITVIDQVPTLSYSPSTLVLTKNNQSSDLPLSATLTGSGDITSWVINATLPAGLNFGTSNGTIWGIPTVSQATATTYTIWANNTGGSSSATVTITVNDEAPGPFEYIPENNTWTNNSYVNIGPSFINQTSGNGSRWSVSLPNTEFAVVVGDIVYLTGEQIPFRGDDFHAFNTSNGTGYDPNPTWYLENGSASVYDTYNHGRDMSYLIGDVIYFDASWGGGAVELWAYNTSNNSGWVVKGISNPGQYFSTQMGDTIYFSANSGNASLGVELWAHDTSNGTTWRVGYTNTTGTLPSTNAFTSYGRDLGVIGDTIYFQAWGSGGEGMWAYNTSNTTMWEVDFSSAVRSVNPGKCMAVVVGDSLYFDADGSTHGRELWAHNHANQTTWMVKDLETNTHYQARDSSPGCLGMSGVLVGDTFYFTAKIGYTNGNYELWAHSTSNHSTWLVADIMSSTTAGSLPGYRLAVAIGDTIYFDAKSYNDGFSYSSQRDLWAYDTSNKSTWEVYNFSRLGSQGIARLVMAVGDTVYFTADDTNPIAHGLWAYDTSNQSTWLVENGSSGMSWGYPGYGTNFLINGTLYTSLGNCNSYSPGCNAGYNLLSINYQTNTGGNVTSWAINGSLPSGVTFNTQTGVLSGTPTELWPQTSYMVWANNSGGSSTAYLNITVVDELPTIAYSPTDMSLTNNTASSDLPLIPTTTGPGEITSWAINASLPAGLTFETSNGTIWGTPTELWPQTSYIVWANNSGGSSIAYLNITVVDQLPTISYVPENLTLTNNTASSDLPLAPTINGPGEITSWAINATLPGGITFGSNNGTIYGTPTELWLTTSYTIWANNTGGSIIAYLNITVEDQLPTSLNYIPNGQNATINTAITTMNPSLTGPGQITSWEISPVLPQGVQFNSSTGVITGTPTELWTNTTYTIWANNTGGSINTTIWLAVTLPAPNISYNFVNITLTSNVSSINYNATNSGGDIAYGDNVIHGHSDVFCALSEQGQVVCWGDNIDGVARPGASTSADYSPSIVSMPTGRYATALAVGNEFACALLDNGSVACWGDADSSTALEYWDGEGIIEPTLMPGLGGTAVAIDIDAGYAHACVILSNLSAMCWGTNAWDNLGINSNSLSATPAHVSVIPSGRTIIDITAGHTHTCALLDNASVYCWGDNQRGQIGVGYTSSSIANGAYAQLDGKQVSVLEAGRDSTCVAFTGGGASCWGKNRDGMLGDGTTIDRSSPTEVQGLGDNDSISSFELSFDTTCIITTENIAICWGDETGNANGASTSPVEVDFPANRYAISIALDHDNGCAILDNGSISCWGSGSDKNFGDNSTSYSRTPVSGVTQISHRANVGGYSIRGGLPQGIQFSASNGTVWGMPTEVVSQFVNYSVTVYNSAGSSTYSFSIQVIDLLPTISYNPENLTFTNNTGHPDLPLAPNITGAGSITSWEISPSLPAGLNFGSENGTIWGVPNQLLNLTTFTVYANNSGGSSTATINLTIVDQVPVLIYNPSNITLTRGEQSDVLPLEPNLSGPGDVLTWEISPALPSGIQFGSDNGTIWGIPTVNMTQTSFTIWANNSGGQTNFTINITILEPVAIFDYQPENLTLVRNETMTSLHPLITGGNPLTWEISPTLPTGLSFSDGVISGTPVVNSSTVMYTIWANNSGGSTNHTINITILEPTGDLFYNPENLTLIRNQSMTTLNPTFTGGSVDNWSIFPTLPSGLLFNNGIISGTPLVNSTTVTYTIWANNSGGVATATINITILEPIVNLSYNPENITLIRNQSMNTLYPTVTGGVVSEWSIYPSLPLGLNFTNGVISGTPEVNMTTTMYSIYANTSAGSTFANINITILEPVVNLSFQPTEIILIRNSSMTPISAVVTGGSVATWEISPQLPSGLTFIDGTLNGTPLVNMTRSEFIIYANTSGGSANFSINITILEPAPQISINPQNVTLMRYEQMDAVSAEIIGDGMPENWSIHPVLPEGLFFENGTIYGTPAVNLTRSTFIIWANNTGGSTSIPFDIEILEPLPNISYSPENYTLTRGLDNVTINPISTGGMVANWSIYPELPQGMSFENGSISGISIVESLNVTYVITAVNSGGPAVAYLNISVVEQLPELSIDVNLSLIRYGEAANLTVNNSGGNASTWEIHPELPDGLSFVDGVLTGVAQVNSTETVYTVWANNSGGSASASFSLEINEPSPDISYQTESYVAVYDATEVLIIPINTGGVPETWEISPQLPQGLQFRNGVIFGVATEQMNQTNYTVWANNSLGSSMTSFTLEVNYPVFFARYEKTRIVLEVNETMMPLTPIYYFGPSQSPTWSISDDLPEGMKFNNGVISGTPQHPLNETQYTITVTGEMAPVELFVVIHVLGDWPQNATVVNETIDQPEPESPNEPELNFVIPLIFLLLLFVAALVGGNIFLAAIADDDEEEDEEDSENEDDFEESGA